LPKTFSKAFLVPLAKFKPPKPLIPKIVLENKQNKNAEETELIMKLSPLYLEQIDIATKEGEATGIAKGIDTGVERGRVEEGRSLITRQLTRKLGQMN
jgi:hypothetical protein